jgi:hypothetical protein
MSELTSQITQSSSQTNVQSTPRSTLPLLSLEQNSATQIPGVISQHVTEQGTVTQLNIQGHQYLLAAISRLTANQVQNQTIQILADATTVKALLQGEMKASMTLLGQTIQIALPSSLNTLANQNGVSNQQLSTLASRTQGYPLGLTQVEGGKLTFDNGTSIALEIKMALPKGIYHASIAQQQGQLILKLSQVQGQLAVSLVAKTPQAIDPSATPQGQIVLTRDEPGQLLSLWVKKLEAIPFRDNIATVKNTSEVGINKSPSPLSTSSLTNTSTVNNAHSTSASDKISFQQQALSNQNQNLTGPVKNANVGLIIDKNISILGVETVSNDQKTLHNTKKKIELAPMDVLQKALSKAGAMPIVTTSLLTEKNNLASQLLKILPSLVSMPLTQYADPQQLQSQLASLTHLNLTQTQLQTAPKFTGEAVTTLFQLLLGFKAQNNGKEVSSKLQLHLQQLSRNLQLKMGQQLLSALDKNASLESLSQLTNSLSLYQQASSDTSQNLVWYFALPYGINQREEQLEGKFEREKNNDNDESNGWRLQLKFNLTQGPLIINAHRQDSNLELKFSANNQALLDRVNHFQGPLTRQMAQVGFTLNSFSTQIAAIPPTLLPGDHYLVKTKA